MKKNSLNQTTRTHGMPGFLRLGIVSFLWLALAPLALAFWPPAQNVQASKSFDASGMTISFQTTDPMSGAIKSDSVRYADSASCDWGAANVTVQDGVVAWVAYSTVHNPLGWDTGDCIVCASVYDPVSGEWKTTTLGSYTGYRNALGDVHYDWRATVTVSGGIVAWVARYGNSKNISSPCEIGAAVYDPNSASWKTTSHRIEGRQSGDFILESSYIDWDATVVVRDGVVAWISNIFSARGNESWDNWAGYATYSPFTGSWKTETTSYDANGTQANWYLRSLDITNSVVTWSASRGGTTENETRSYNWTTNSWGNTAVNTPVACFYTLPSVIGNAPLTVWFIDMSVGGTTGRQWSFGDGSWSNTRSTYHVYSGKGVFTASQSVSGPGGSDTASQVIDTSFTYTTIGNVITITDYDGPGGELTIPGMICGLPVTSIGSSAFSGCSGLTSVTIPDSVTSIGNEAFLSCSGLTSVTIPNSVTSIGEGAFYSCSGLTSITIGNGITSLSGFSFPSYPYLTSVAIGNSVSSIADSAFMWCRNLTSITIPDSVTSIGNEAFGYCDLTSVTIPNSVTSIGDYAFYNCSGLTSVTIPNSVTSIGEGAFYSCSGLTSITIGNGITSLSGFLFPSYPYLTSVAIGNSVTSIGEGAFSGCSGLTAISVDGLNSGYSSLDGILFNKSQTILIQCPGGKAGSVTIPNSVTSIGDYAFYDCNGLTSVTIPNSVTSIGEEAFFYCSGLTSITIGNGITGLSGFSFL